MVIDQVLEQEIELFHKGLSRYSYRLLGAHEDSQNGEIGIRFIVWAPHAAQVNVVGVFNHWDSQDHTMQKINDGGLWYLFIPNLEKEQIYKYEITTKQGNVFLKADPYAFSSELRPNTASVVHPIQDYDWKDQEWMKRRKETNLYESPLSIYEMHLGSWKYIEREKYYTYREYAEKVIPYVKELGYTHIELLPINEHPYDRSWGYQLTGYYSVTSRYGTAEDFRYFVDCCHQHGLGVLLDWVPGHFCKDDHGLRQFDGEALFEYRDPGKAEKHSWGTLSFDTGCPEVQSFLISNAIYWLKEFHVDGLRVDAVASMLYLDYDKEHGQWKPNKYGGRENLEAIGFLKQLNEAVFAEVPDILMMAEESTAWPLVSYPTYVGGLGFNYKWNMGWMNDILRYMEMDPIYRKYHHHLITFSIMYAFSENFILPISHDELVHGKKSLLNKMPGDYWKKFANLRLFLGYMFTHPGKKLLFMGSEFGQFDEWKDMDELDWNLLSFESHQQVSTYLQKLQQLYKQLPALWELDHKEEGFTWIDANNYEQSIISFIRHNKDNSEEIVIICNFTPVVYHHYKVGVPEEGLYQEIFSSDSLDFGGSGQVNDVTLPSINTPWQSQNQHIEMTIPPLAISVIKSISS
ncbi:1,4-alpha-glucan branching enzyme GlgB [Paraliobacillus sp. PM-2]|uniref:1,4-alpha-glucan branching protein GlgB n=1 Tax=Paraliobacillus sp. PM-2 TaxID=1462524 RepID=UPI00061C15D3|nr:1,4-alpha-glucan branching protein GlgB [Paraliobacillus sp. PM-2]CQR47118.1 1,4-alpha-glucan branching enzyme GlgB [Paraliobacillus sp. PM-2]